MDPHRLVFVNRDLFDYHLSALQQSDRYFLIQILYSICEQYANNENIFFCAVMLHEMM